MDHPNAVHRDAEDARGDLAEGGLVALPVRGDAGEHGRRAVGMHLDGAELAGEPGDLNVRAEADPELDPVPPRPPLGLLLPQSLVPAHAEGLIEGPFVVADVVPGP